jgi:hypothetical protein
VQDEKRCLAVSLTRSTRLPYIHCSITVIQCVQNGVTNTGVLFAVWTVCSSLSPPKIRIISSQTLTEWRELAGIDLLLLKTGRHEHFWLVSSSLQSREYSFIRARGTPVIRLAAAELTVDVTGLAKTTAVRSIMTAGCDQSCGAAYMLLFTDISFHVQLCTFKNQTFENTCNYSSKYI